MRSHRSHPSHDGLQRLYAEVAPTYERVNHALTLGLDILWRRRTARRAVAVLAGLCRRRGAPLRVLDACSGTGELAAAVARRASGSVAVHLADLSAPMLAGARAKPHLSEAALTVAAMESLPFADGAFDLITISFATRNLNRQLAVLRQCLREFHRILAPGGCYCQVETSQPPNRIWRLLFHAYVAFTVRPIGRLISGSRSGYAYLAHTIPRFMTAAEFDALLAETGFVGVGHELLGGGIGAIHWAARPAPAPGAPEAEQPTADAMPYVQDPAGDAKEP